MRMEALIVIYLPAALDNMVVPAVSFFPMVHFPLGNPKMKTETIILGLEKSAKLPPDRVCRGIGLSPLFHSIEPGGLSSVCNERREPSIGPGSMYM
jgi:hypothetical protein